MCPEKRQSFVNISLTRNTISVRISELAADIDGLLKKKMVSFVTFSVTIDESADIAQLALFIRGVDARLPVTEEFVQLVPMKES